MADLHVLLIGPLSGAACDVYRFGMHQAALAAHGVELRAFAGARLTVPASEAHSLDRAYASADLVMDRSEIDWADVLVFRRFYTTHWACLDCAFTSPREAQARLHATSVKHELVEPDRLVVPLFTALERYPTLLRGRAMVYETDDDLLNVQPWNGMRFRIEPERGVIDRMIRRADLVTVSTPSLRARLAERNDAVRVVRNAVDPSWYRASEDAPPVTGSPRILYYGSPSRMRDYDVCRPAVDAVAAETAGARRVWLGALNARAGGAADRVVAAVDEAGPYIGDTRAFAAALTAARPDIGLAPLVGDSFDEAKSELHWLEYAMAGAATVASRVAAYEPIRDGVDGLLASSRAEWLDALRRLTGSTALREDIAGRARERVLAEYTVDVRAAEWADAYRWAAEHAGRAAEGRVHGLGALPAAVVEAQGRAAVQHRAAVRAALAAAPERLDSARGGRPSCGVPAAADSPALVSVVVPVADEPDAAVLRAVGSALASTHGTLEVLIAVDGERPPGVAEALAAADPRVQVRRVETCQTLPPGDAPRAAWQGRLLAAGVAAGHGDWIAPLAPDAEFRPDHVEVMLGIALEHELEFVYGQAAVVAPGAAPVLLGAWPPTADEVLTVATELFAAGLADVVPLDPDAWRDGDTTGWAFWRSAMAAGVRMAGIDYVVTALAPLPGRGGAEAGRQGVAAEPAPQAPAVQGRERAHAAAAGAKQRGRGRDRADRRAHRGR